MVGAPAAAYFKRATLGVISVSGLVYGTAAVAGNWTITPSLSVLEEFTDNVDLNFDNENRNSAFTTQISPGLSIAGGGAGGRTSLNLNYIFSPSYNYLGSSEDKRTTSNTLAAVGQIELWKRVVFVDAQANISQVIEDGTGPTANSVAGQTRNRTEARTFSVSPNFRHHIGQWLDTESRLTLNHTSVDTQLVEDTLTRTGTFTINGGRRFALFPWSVVVLDSKTENDGSQPDETERRADGSFSYVLDRKITLTGTVGWEEIEDPALTNQPSGITWSGGFTARPGSRTSLKFSYGDRNGDTDISATASHRISVRTSVDASFSESIQTSQGLLAQRLSGILVDENGVPIGIVPVTRFGLSESTFRQRLFRLGFSGTRRRNQFSGGGFWEERNTDSTGITETQYGANLALSRKITPRLDGSVSASASTTDFGTPDKRENIDYTGAASLSYKLGNTIQATVSYNLTLTKVKNAPGDLLVNSVSIGLTKSF